MWLLHINLESTLQWSGCVAMRHAVASERRGHPRPRGGGRVRRRQVPRQRDAGNGGRGRSERSERSPLRGKLLPLRSSAHKKIIARTDVPWSDVWRGSRRSMDTNRCQRANQYALEAPRIAIALSDDLRERERSGYDDVCSRAEAQQSVAAAELRS